MTPTPVLPSLPEPFVICYEWKDLRNGTRRSFSAAPYNGMRCSNSLALYTAEQYQAGQREAYDLGARSTAAQPVEPTGLRSAALELIDKLDALKPHMDSMCLDAHNRGRPYSGPTYGEELEALRAAASGDSTPPSAQSPHPKFGYSDTSNFVSGSTAGDAHNNRQILAERAQFPGDPSGALRPEPEAALNLLIREKQRTEAMREVMLRMMAGIDHLAEIARQWEPDHSSGADRRGWVLAKDARDDAARLLQPEPPQAASGSRGDGR